MRISLLDRANVLSDDPDGATALRRAVDRARHADDLGIHRFLVAEHHGVPGLAGSVPAALAAAVGQATSRIRVGTAGIMLPDHAPLVVAEQATVLESLFPGRVDIGLGSSVGFTAAVRRALRQDGDAATAREGFPDDLAEVAGYLSGESEVVLRPRPAAPPRLFLLTGGSDRSIAAAASLGLGAVIGGRDAASVAQAVGRYRAAVAQAPEAPEVIVAVTAAVAATEEAARDLVLPEVWAQVMSRSTGVFSPLRPVGELDEAELTAQQRRRVERGLAATVHGTPEQVRRRLDEVVEQTGVEDILVTGGMSDVAGQWGSDRALAAMSGGQWG
jgi:luciferase family oxidoreductase group 1